MYSVSPRRNAKIRGPKPIEKRGAYTPSALAAMKCPSSCTKMTSPKTRIGASSAIVISGKPVVDVPASRGIGLKNGFARPAVQRRQRVQCARNRHADVLESYPPLEEE